MTAAAHLPVWAALLVAALLILGAATALTGSIGLLRLGRFYERVHPPTLGSTLATASVIAASILYFSLVETRPVVHEILIAVFVTVTTPVTLMLLVRAALFRDRAAGIVADNAGAREQPGGDAQREAPDPRQD